MRKSSFLRLIAILVHCLFSHRHSLSHHLTFSVLASCKIGQAGWDAFVWHQVTLKFRMPTSQSNSLQHTYPNVNSAWASVLLETLRRREVSTAVISPGSRSGPLAWAAADLALRSDGAFEAIPVLDERSAAFFALGIARRTLSPVVLICTSGTAGANYFPAVIEARESGVPLIILTADRPPEMRHCHSGQTIDQVSLYGHHPVWQTELALPSIVPAHLRYLRQTAIFAAHRALSPFRGPVHINIPFRDPLAPVVIDNGVTLDLDAFFEWPELAEDICRTPLSLSQLLQNISDKKGIIAVGAIVCSDHAALAALLEKLSQATGWPILADALSSLRAFAQNPSCWCAHYDTLLRNDRAAQELAIDFVLQIGQLPTSKILRQWLEQQEPQVITLGHPSENLDCLHNRTVFLDVDADTFAHATLPTPTTPKATAWTPWEAACSTALTQALRESSFFFEGQIITTLSQSLPPATSLVIANSMPVRDAEYFLPITGDKRLLFCNRGANGIDGTLSTALGIAHNGSPTVLLTGDLAFLHDSNGLLIAPKFKGSLTILLINNAGGGIFEHLPIAQFNPPFEEFFATPQHVDFARLAAAHGIPHSVIDSASALTSLLRQPFPSGIRLLEIKTDRKRDAAFRKQLFNSVAQSLAPLSSHE